MSAHARTLPYIGLYVNSFTTHYTSVSGDHFNCIATNVGDVGSIDVAVTLYDDLGNALSSYPIDALAACSDVGPHKSCGITFIQTLLSGVHCEIRVLTGDQANVRGAISSYRFEGDTLIETKLDARKDVRAGELVRLVGLTTSKPG